MSFVESSKSKIRIFLAKSFANGISFDVFVSTDSSEFLGLLARTKNDYGPRDRYVQMLREQNEFAILIIPGEDYNSMCNADDFMRFKAGLDEIRINGYISRLAWKGGPIPSWPMFYDVIAAEQSTRTSLTRGMKIPPLGVIFWKEHPNQ